MSWICPQCKRKLPGPNQYHSCYVTDLESHTKKMSEPLLQTFNLLHEYTHSFVDVEILPLKTCIQFKIGANFLSVYPRKDRLLLEFQLNREDDQFPIFKCIRISKNRVLHRLVIAHPEEFDSQVKNWIHEAYLTIRKK